MAEISSVAILDLGGDEPLARAIEAYLRRLFPAVRVARYPLFDSRHVIPLGYSASIVIAESSDIERLGGDWFAGAVNEAARNGPLALITDRPLRRVKGVDAQILDINSFRGKERDRRIRELMARFYLEPLEKGHVDKKDQALRDHVLIVDSSGKTSINPILFLRIKDLELSVRTERTLTSDNLKYLGDIVERFEPQLLRIPNFGRKSLLEIRSFLAPYGIRIGSPIPGWRPYDIEEQAARAAATFKISRIEQAKLGARFEPRDNVLVIDASGNDTDVRASARPVVIQLHEEVLRKAAGFASVARRIDNHIGWQGIGSFCERLNRLLNRPTAAIPDVLGSLYSAVLELGSYLEMDRGIEGTGAGFAEPLDPEVRRPLEDLLRSIAPWMRSFPTIREMDDEAGQFLTREPLLEPSSRVIAAADKTILLRAEDTEALRGLLDAANRGDFQGGKAGQRGVLSVRNMITVAASVLGMVAVGAVGSAVATQSVLAQKAGAFLLQAEAPILEVISALPGDVRLAMEMLIADLQKNPPALPAEPRPTPTVAGPIRRRR
jgi:Bacterial RNA polymerase, alpha chain C terminal domain